jgi:hypothetical protein
MDHLIYVINENTLLNNTKNFLHGLASANKEQIDSKTLEIVKAGDQLSLRISRQMAP